MRTHDTRPARFEIGIFEFIKDKINVTTEQLHYKYIYLYPNIKKISIIRLNQKKLQVSLSLKEIK